MDSLEQAQPANQQQSTLIGVVLAGGMSRRMGSDKALLRFQGSTLLQHQVGLLQPLCAQVLVSGDYAGFASVPDSVERCGPLGGIYSLAQRNPSAALLVIPVDMPQLTENYLRALIDCQQTCFIDGHPLPALFRESKPLLMAINGILADAKPNFSIWNLHHILNSKALPLADFNGLNINEPNQWQEFLLNT